MANHPHHPNQPSLAELLDGARAGDPEARQSLNQHLREQPLAREAIVELLATESAILDHFEEDSLKFDLSEIQRPILQKRHLITIAVALSALIAFAAILLLPSSSQDPSRFLTVAQEGSIALDDGTRLNAGKRLGSCRIALHEGETGTLDYDNGTRLDLVGPLELDITSPLLAILHLGKLSAHVPKGAIGFTIEAPEFKVVDLGTAFTMEIRGANGWVDVHEGAVELSAGNTTPARLDAGRSAHVTGGNINYQDLGKRIAESAPFDYSGVNDLPTVYHDAVSTSEGLPHVDAPSQERRIPITLQAGTETLSVGLWFRQKKATTETVLFTIFKDQEKFIRFSREQDERRLIAEGFFPDNIAAKVSHPRFAPDTWNHVVVVYRGDALRMFINGEYAGSRPLDERLDLSGRLQMRIPAQEKTEIRGIAIYPRALEGFEVREYLRVTEK